MMKTKTANFAFLLLLVMLLVAWQIRSAFCSPDVLYLRSGTVSDSPTPSPSGEQLGFAEGSTLKEVTVSSTTTSYYWYSQRYTGTVASGDWNLYVWQKKSGASVTVNYYLDRTSPDGQTVYSIASYTGYIEGTAAYSERQITFSGVAETSFNDERLRVRIEYSSGGALVVAFNSTAVAKANSRVVTPSSTPPIPELPLFDGSQTVILIINLIGIAFFLKRFRKADEKDQLSAGRTYKERVEE